MPPVGFYHLTRSAAEQALPPLLGRTLDLGKRALVLVRDAERAAAIDEALWQAPEPVWLPHGSDKLGHAALQPIWIASPGAETQPAPNAAEFVFLLDGVEPRSLVPFERAFDLFDGGCETALAAARGRWSRLKQAGMALTYWKQDAKGWQKAG